MIVVSDTGPINYLILIGQVDLLHILFDEVLLPTAVHGELTAEGAPPPVTQWAHALPDWGSIKDPISMSTVGRLGRGELAAIALATELGVPLLCDDGQARLAARNAGLGVSGTLGVLQIAHARSLIDIGEALERLEKTSFRRSKTLFESIRKRSEAMRQNRQSSGS